MEKSSGQFQTLQNISYFRHGFSVGYPSMGFQNGVITDDTIQTHKSFLQDHDMGPYENAMVIKADGTPLAFVDEIPEKDPEVPFFAYVRGECIVSSVKGYSFNIKLADCAGFIGTVVAKDGTELLFILHGSRNVLAQKFWVNALQEAQKKYQFNPADIRGGVTPHMCSKCHILHNLNALPNAEEWQSKKIVSQDTQGLWHFDSTRLLQEQLLEAGVRSEQVSIDNQCTYEMYTKAIEAGEQPPLFSHRAYNDHQQDSRFHNGRFVLSGMLI